MHEKESANIHEGLELAALVETLSAFLGRPLGRVAAPGAMMRESRRVKEYCSMYSKLDLQGNRNTGPVIQYQHPRGVDKFLGGGCSLMGRDTGGQPIELVQNQLQGRARKGEQKGL